jgi:threonine/homoserine/homoserine lactone efflux protein
MDIEILFLFTLTSISLTLTPGPDILYVLSQSLSYGLKSGLLVSLGLVSGLFFHTAFVSFGFGFIISEYPDVFRFIKYFGSIYLIFIAISILLNKRSNENIKTIKNTSLKNYSIGLVMNLVNPKVSLFFISIFPLFLFDKTLSIMLQFFILGIIFIIQAIIVFSLVSLLASYMGRKVLSLKTNKLLIFFQSFVLFIIAFLLIYL